MKRKNIFPVIVLVAVVVLIFTGCSGKKETSSSVGNSPVASQGGNSTPSSGGEKTDWQSWVKDNRGVSITMPDGWTVKSIEQPRSYQMEVKLNIGGSTTNEAFGQQVFDATKTVAVNGNRVPDYSASGAIEGSAIADFASAADKSADGTIVLQWCYTYNSRLYTVDYNASTDTVSLMFY